MTSSLVLLLATGCLLGMRHGVDWDHIAAISDITSAQPHPWRAMRFGSMYALGHSTIIFSIGLLAILLGLTLPPWIDSFMEHVVGATLLLLGVWVLLMVAREGKAFRLRSRWMLLVEAAQRLFRRHRHEGEPEEHQRAASYGEGSCFTLGLLHGAGAETPTQVILFATAAGAGGVGAGGAVLFCFVIGLLLCNSSMSLLAALGFRSARHSTFIALTLGIITGIFSSIVGVLFLLGKSALLPGLLGG